MSHERKIEISEDLTLYSNDPGDGNHGLNAYAGPIAEHIARLEARIEELEARPTSGATIQNLSSSIDTRTLTIQDVADLIRASK